MRKTKSSPLATISLQKEKPASQTAGFEKIGRCERIRTFDPLHPMQVRYQAAPHTEGLNYNAPHMNKQVSGSKQVADFSEFSANQFKTLAGHAAGQNLGQKICI